jgi:hypothetical protein
MSKAAKKTVVKDWRAGKHIIAAHIETNAFRDFKVLAAQQLKSTDAMVHEALALLYEKYKQPVPPAIKQKLEQQKKSPG